MNSPAGINSRVYIKIYYWSWFFFLLVNFKTETSKTCKNMNTTQYVMFLKLNITHCDVCNFVLFLDVVKCSYFMNITNCDFYIYTTVFHNQKKKDVHNFIQKRTHYVRGPAYFFWCNINCIKKKLGWTIKKLYLISYLEYNYEYYNVWYLFFYEHNSLTCSYFCNIHFNKQWLIQLSWISSVSIRL